MKRPHAPITSVYTLSRFFTFLESVFTLGDSQAWSLGGEFSKAGPSSSPGWHLAAQRYHRPQAGALSPRRAETARWRAASPSPDAHAQLPHLLPGAKAGRQLCTLITQTQGASPQDWGGQVAHETTNTQLLALSSSEMEEKTQLLGGTELLSPQAWSRAWAARGHASVITDGRRCSGLR